MYHLNHFLRHKSGGLKANTVGLEVDRPTCCWGEATWAGWSLMPPFQLKLRTRKTLRSLQQKSL